MNNFKLTPQRLAILDHLKGNIEHPSVEDIYNAVLNKFPSMSLATVYNTLEALKKRDRISELTIDPYKKRFDPNIVPHHHLICVKCKKIVDIHANYDLQIPRAMKTGFEIKGNHIEFYGICPHCRNKN